MQNWPLLLLELLLFITVIAAWIIAKRGHISVGMVVAQIACLAFIVLFSLFFDVPSQAVPRVSHLYLLIIALAGYVNHQLSPSRSQLGIIVSSIFAFIVLSASPMNFGFATNLPDTVRMMTVWAHALLTAGVLCGGVVLLQTNFSSATRLISELRSAIGKKQFELFFQPQVEASGKLIGAEALIRWKHPTRGYIAPDKFIPVAEQAGLMPDIGKWVLETAVQTLALWNASDRTRDLVLSINVSPDQFLSEDFAKNIKSLLRDSGVVSRSLKLELTETMFVSEVDSLITKIQELKDSGIAIALDDFGTGYSSLSYLRHLPLQQLKIDRSFVQAINTDRGALMARSISQMGHDLGLEILAEGIETEEQFRFMLDCGCKVFQGYYFGRPVTLAAFQEYLNSV